MYGNIRIKATVKTERKAMNTHVLSLEDFEEQEVFIGFTMRVYKGLVIHESLGKAQRIGVYTISNAKHGRSMCHVDTTEDALRIVAALTEIHDWTDTRPVQEMLDDEQLKRKVQGVAKEFSGVWISV